MTSHREYDTLLGPVWVDSTIPLAEDLTGVISLSPENAPHTPP